MKILIAGGTGFVGRHLTQFLRQSHQVTILTRSPKKSDGDCFIEWDGKRLVTEQQVDVIINLCGMGIASKIWTKKNKQKLLDSRIEPTQAIINFISDYPGATKPRLINASAIGYYPSSRLLQDESSCASLATPLFSTKLVAEWERCALAATDSGATVSCLRFGVVLGKGGGLVAKLLPSYRLGLGAVIGNRDASLSWVHIHDVCRAISFVMSLDQPQLIYNVTAPQACTQLEFSKTFAARCHRSCFLRLPPFFVAKLFGQMGRELLLADQKIYPKRLIDEQFDFNYPNIDAALANIFSKERA